MVFSDLILYAFYILTIIVLQFIMWNCYSYDTQRYIETAGFSKLQLNEIELDFKGMRLYGPMYSLKPHIYGIAVK